MIINDCKVHPLFSKDGIVAFLEREDVMDSFDEDDFEEIQRFVVSTNLPKANPLFDISARYLSWGYDEEEYDQSEVDQEDRPRAGFHMCVWCGNHGILFDHRGDVLAKPLTKKEALEQVERLVELGLIKLEDRKEVREKIFESPLRNLPE